MPWNGQGEGDHTDLEEIPELSDLAFAGLFLLLGAVLYTRRRRRGLGKGKGGE